MALTSGLPARAAPKPAPAGTCFQPGAKLDPHEVRMCKRFADATAAYQRGDFGQAADLYWQGWLEDEAFRLRTQPDRAQDGAFLYGSARALHVDGRLEPAILRYQAMLALDRQQPGVRDKAFVGLAQALLEAHVHREPLEPAPAAEVLPAPASPEVAAVEPAPAASPTQLQELPSVAPPAVAIEAPSTLGPWLLGLSGAGLALTGTVLSALAAADRRDFQARMEPGFEGQPVDGYPDRSSALAAAEAIGDRQTWGAAVLTTGLTMALSGWLWHRWTSPSATLAVQARNR